MTIDLLKLEEMADEDGYVYVETKDYVEILNSYVTPYDPKPQPPIKRRSKTRETGFFSTRSFEEKEYDHHAPEYLRELEEWRKRQDNQVENRELRFYGPTKELIIKVKQ